MIDVPPRTDRINSTKNGNKSGADCGTSAPRFGGAAATKETNMNSRLPYHLDVRIRRQGRVDRRSFLHALSSAGAAAGLLSWMDVMSLQADELRRQGRACILLWMQGGPSQFETFSPKPDHANGGETKAIATSVPGIEISENLPRIAQVMGDVCLIRSMTSREGSHPRASYLLHTGYLPTAAVKYPTLGAHVAHQLGTTDFDLPGFVRIGQGRDGGGGGILGVRYDPFVVTNAGQMPQNTQVADSERRYRRRLKLLNRLEDHYAQNGDAQKVLDHQKVYEAASQMVLSPKMDVFDLQGEPAKVQEAYGTTPFAKGCLLARRLIETGVTFVEVAAGNWDTHDNNFERSRELCQTVDQPTAALLADLKQRGLLDKTLLIWMGEFGRTPRVNPRAGRDHYPRAFNVALAGGGVRGGQVIGKTDAGGTEVTDQPVTVPDLFRTVFTALNIDPDHENLSSIGRPIKLVEGGQVVSGVL
jgi:uncharacterized protein (DUF1501 family)